MKKIQLIAALLVVAGCATPADRRKNPPNLDLTSKKNAKQVAVCIADKWENTKPFMGITTPSVNTMMKRNGYSITATEHGGHGTTNIITLADVVEGNPGSATKYYKQGGGGFGAYDEAVMQCQ